MVRFGINQVVVFKAAVPGGRVFCFWLILETPEGSSRVKPRESQDCPEYYLIISVPNNFPSNRCTCKTRCPASTQADADSRFTLMYRYQSEQLSSGGLSFARTSGGYDHDQTIVKFGRRANLTN